MFDEAGIDELKADRSRLVAGLEEAGAEVRGDTVRCPFHDDTTASANLHQGDDGAQLFTCHACTWNGGKSTGDLVHVTQRFHDLDFPGALQRLGLRPSPDGKRNSNAAKPSAPKADELATARREAEAANQRLLESADAQGRMLFLVEILRDRLHE